MSALQRAWYPAAEPGLATRLAWAPASLLSWAFGAGVGLKNALYDRGLLASARPDGVRIISVGNLNVGGAGKTPVVMFLANRLSRAGRKVAVLSRGFGRKSDAPLAFDSTELPSWREAGDEPVLIASRCPGVRVYVGSDRVECARAAVQDGFDLLLLDDGFQHRRLGRDCDVVVIDEGDGFGNGRLLPRGPLREPPDALSRASLIWLRASARPSRLPALSLPIVRARHAPSEWLDEAGVAHPAAELGRRKVHALCGLARPWTFVETLRSLGAEVVGHTFLPDHQPPSEAQLSAAAREASSRGALLLTTEKDAVKLSPPVRLPVLRLEVELLGGEEQLDRLLLAAPARPR